MGQPEPEETQPQPREDSTPSAELVTELTEVETKEKSGDASRPVSLGNIESDISEVHLEMVKTRIYSKKSSSESNLLVEKTQGRFNRKSGGRQSMPQGHTNYGLIVSDEDESNLEI